MALLAGKSVLILDPCFLRGYELRAHFARQGAVVHVVNSIAQAATFARNKKIDTAFIPFAQDHAALEFQALLTRLGFPYVFTPSIIGEDETTSISPTYEARALNGKTVAPATT